MTVSERGEKGESTYYKVHFGEGGAAEGRGDCGSFEGERTNITSNTKHVACGDLVDWFQ